MASNLLTDAALRRAKPTDKLQRLRDGDGLYLLLRPDGKRWWRFDYRLGGKDKTLSLGVYPDVTLARARQRADEIRQQLLDDIDPSAARKAAAQAPDPSEPAPPPDAFETVAREWMQRVHALKVTAGHAEQTRFLLEQNVLPWLGRIPIGSIRPPELLACLRRVADRGALDTAHRVKRACGQVFRYGIATGVCERDISADLRDALPPPLVEHHAAIIEPGEFGGLLRAIDVYKGHPSVIAALQLSPLVFLRPGELRHARWSEIDLDGALWTIPADRMKRTKQEKISGQPHLVPLARQAVDLLREIRPFSGRSEWVFPSPRSYHRPISEIAVLAALKRMGVNATAHGFRASARTMLAERLGFDDRIIEAQLAHSVPDALGRAYNRTEFVAQRRAMMQAWADYLDKLKGGRTI
ncbi:MAG: integrase arm-type DNA-binding domain-containing protein [Thiomonas sp.]|uniref:tyrosine-type recombinase/integrase n=1 Tax=Thiomonas sp. TaxID=2047785 RepID=UPI002A35E0C8|nr:integrase arm-type DNA-binding domain-containing protein [Thiomonas sp.]MDY0331144.1 integrase arm-type DNA-binding domain-containing protein [Thiomonas sp.]